MTALVIVLVVAAAVALVALAWWASGRSRGAEHHTLSAAERGDAEVRTMKHHRPNGSAPVGPGGG